MSAGITAAPAGQGEERCLALGRRIGDRQWDGQQRAWRGCWPCPHVGIEPVGKGAGRKGPAWDLSEPPCPSPGPLFLGDPPALLPSPGQVLGPLHLPANPQLGNQRKRRHRKAGKALCCKPEAAAESRTKPARSRHDSAAQLEQRQQIGPSRFQLQRVPARLPSKAEVPGKLSSLHGLTTYSEDCTAASSSCCICLARRSFLSTRCEDARRATPSLSRPRHGAAPSGAFPSPRFCFRGCCCSPEHFPSSPPQHPSGQLAAFVGMAS